MAGNLRVEERQPRDPRGLREREQPRDGCAGVVREQREAIDPEHAQQRREAARLAGEGEVGGGAPTAVAESWQVEHEAGVALRELRQQRAPGVAVHREAVDQHQRGAAAGALHATVASPISWRSASRSRRRLPGEFRSRTAAGS
jgi:hypothetical protein